MTDKEKLTVKLTLQHKENIATLLAKFAAELTYRSAVHDNSKFFPDEFDILSDNVCDFNKYLFDTKEEQDLRERLLPASILHRKRNRHHPEHFENGIDGMNIIDLLEMLCDWKSASTRVSGDSLRKGLPILKKKYNISSQLLKILENTARDFMMY